MIRLWGSLLVGLLGCFLVRLLLSFGRFLHGLLLILGGFLKRLLLFLGNFCGLAWRIGNAVLLSAGWSRPCGAQGEQQCENDDALHLGCLLPFNYIIQMRSGRRSHSAGQFDGQNQGFGTSNDLFGVVFAKRFQIYQIRSHTQSK